MRRQSLLITLLFGVIWINLYAQNVAITDDNGYSADPSAMLDVMSVDKGILVPRLSTLQRISVINPAEGLLVFDTDEGNFYFYNGTGWISLSSASNGIWEESASKVYLSNNGNKVGVGTSNPFGKLEVIGDIPVTSEDPLFEVINSNGDTVFAVYSQGVRVYVDDNPGAKVQNSRGGFAVGGYSQAKGLTNEYLRVTPDSIRMYIDDNGGQKAVGSKGGFAVGGFSQAKTTINDYFNISGADSAEVIDPSEARIVWYPQQEAFLTGRVLIEDEDSVGLNSMASGFESKAVGDYSQAVGYQSIARGKYSQAFGYMSETNSDYSFASGFWARAYGSYSFAIGLNAISSGYNSVAMGNLTQASQSFGFAMGDRTISNGSGAAVFGIQEQSNGSASFAAGAYGTASGAQSACFGRATTASGNYSFATNFSTTANNDAAFASGWASTASGQSSFATNFATNATGNRSFATGSATTASGTSSAAFNSGTEATGVNTTAMGQNATAQSYTSLAIGRYNILEGTADSWVDTEPLFVAGNGTSSAARSNAMTLYKNGDMDIQGSITQEVWQAPVLLNSWENYSVQYNPAGYFRDKNGIVHLRGNVKNGSTINAVMFNLPAGYRPEYREIHVGTSNGTCRVDVDINGNVWVVTGGSTSAVSLDGITFRAAGY